MTVGAATITTSMASFLLRGNDVAAATMAMSMASFPLRGNGHWRFEAMTFTIHGISASKGIAIGRVHAVDRGRSEVVERRLDPSRVEARSSASAGRWTPRAWSSAP